MTGGVRAGLEAAMGEAGELPDGQQLVQSALFDGLSEADTGALDAPSPLSAALQRRTRKGGRPKGARNRRTDAVASWLLSQHRHPLSVMMEAYSMTTVELASRIGLAPVRREIVQGPDGQPVEVPVFENGELIELFKLQQRMAEAAAPYLAQKMPQAVQLDAKGHVVLTLGGVSLPARGGVLEAGDLVQGEVMGVRLGAKSDASDRTDG